MGLAIWQFLLIPNILAWEEFDMKGEYLVIIYLNSLLAMGEVP